MRVSPAEQWNSTEMGLDESPICEGFRRVVEFRGRRERDGYWRGDMRIGEMRGKKVNWIWGGFTSRWDNSTSGGEREVRAE